jgi:hypothetical protein
MADLTTKDVVMTRPLHEHRRRPGPLSHDMWPEDRRQLLDRVWDRAWWTGLQGLSAVGVLCALASWGPLVTSVVALSVGAVRILVALPFRVREQAPGSRAALRGAASTGCVTVAALGLIAVAAAWALIPMLVLASASPAVHRIMRDASTVVRASLAIVSTMIFEAPPADEGIDRPWL